MTWTARLSAALALVTLAWAACSGPSSGQSCRVDSDCAEPAICVPGGGSGVCVPPCMTDSDCMPGLLCEDGTCLALSEGTSCTSQKDCIAPEICDVAAGFCIDECGVGGAGGQGGSGGVGTGGAGGQSGSGGAGTGGAGTGGA